MRAGSDVNSRFGGRAVVFPRVSSFFLPSFVVFRYPCLGSCRLLSRTVPVAVEVVGTAEDGQILQQTGLPDPHAMPGPRRHQTIRVSRTFKEQNEKRATKGRPNQTTVSHTFVSPCFINPRQHHRRLPHHRPWKDEIKTPAFRQAVVGEFMATGVFLFMNISTICHTAVSCHTHARPRAGQAVAALGDTHTHTHTHTHTPDDDQSAFNPLRARELVWLLLC